jgi:hypothetical protein
MAESALKITDAQLLTELQNSFIDPGQKKELTALIPEMTVAEKIELLGIIKRSHVEAEKAGLANKDGLRAINKEYKDKLNKLVKESSENALKDFEQADEKSTAGELKAIEGEIVGLDATVNPKARVKKGHGFRNAVLAMFFLILLATGALYALHYLSNI